MDLSFLYGWDGYYFLQGFWLDIKTLVANADLLTVIICFLILLALFLFIERKRLRIRSVTFAVVASAYATFLLTVTILGRTVGNVSAWDQLFSTYTRALSGEEGSKRDILYNIVLFIPVGLLISYYQGLRRNIIILAVIPLMIELIQLITTRGLFELSDIINNFIGGMIGLFTVRLISFLYHQIKEKRKGGRVERAK